MYRAPAATPDRTAPPPPGSTVRRSRSALPDHVARKRQRPDPRRQRIVVEPQPGQDAEHQQVGDVGRQDAQRAPDVEPLERNPARRARLGQKQVRDQKAAEHEKEPHAELAVEDFGQLIRVRLGEPVGERHVRHEHQRDADRAPPVERRNSRHYAPTRPSANVTISADPAGRSPSPRASLRVRRRSGRACQDVVDRHSTPRNTDSRCPSRSGSTPTSATR